MIDTINVKVDRPLHAEILQSIEDQHGLCDLNDWTFKISPDRDLIGRPRTAVWGEHKPTGSIARGHNGVIEWVQTSLPRVLFGDNGRLIRSPEQLVEAQQRFKLILNGISAIRHPLTEYVRVDLVLHFRCNVEKFIAAHRHCRHPLIRKETAEYGVRGLKLPGTGVGICFYDKKKEMKIGHGDILRVEVQLKKPKLGKLFGKADRPLYALDFSTCYLVYREILCQFEPAEVMEPFGLNPLLAYCEVAGFTLPNGLTAMENYKATVSRDTFLARRRQINGMTLSAAGINWSDLLPKNLLPENLPDVIRPTESILSN
jgi:hypothetical protein